MLAGPAIAHRDNNALPMGRWGSNPADPRIRNNLHRVSRNRHLPCCSHQTTYTLRGPLAAYCRLDNSACTCSSTTFTIRDVGYSLQPPFKFEYFVRETLLPQIARQNGDSDLPVIRPRELLGNPILKLGSSLLHCHFYQRRRTPDWLIINP